MKLRITASALAIGLATPAFAECDEVNFADVGWTDITATTAATTTVLDALGYETDIKVLSVPVTYTSLANGDIDIFLGNWMPTMEGDIAPYREAGTVDTVRANLEGAKYTLAVNKAASDLGIADFADIAKKRSTGPTGAKGGDLGFFSEGDMVPEFSTAAFSLAPGQVSDPVKTEFGWHVIKVEERKAQEPPSFEEAEPQLREEMRQEIGVARIERLRKGVEVELFDLEGKPRESQ